MRDFQQDENFPISGFFAGIAGGFQAHYLMYVGTYLFNVFYSLQAILFAALGGIGTIIGSVVGAYLMQILNEVLRDIAEFRVLVTAIVMLLVFRFLPGGLLREISKRLGFSMEFWSRLKKVRRKKDDTNP